MNRLGYLVLASSVMLGALGWYRALTARTPRSREFIVHNQTKPPGGPAAVPAPRETPERAARRERLRVLSVDRGFVRNFIDQYNDATRDQLIEAGMLASSAPAKGTAMLGPGHRTSEGEVLLQQARDVLYALLFGDPQHHTALERVQRELLTLTVPRGKAPALGFMQAATELTAAGTWQDPDDVSSDEHAENVIIEVEYGEIREEWIGDGIVTALRLINHLEVNEQVLYARMIDIEQSTLID